MKENQQETRKRKENEGKPMENERKTYPNRKTKKIPKKNKKKSRKKSAPLMFPRVWFLPKHCCISAGHGHSGQGEKEE